MEQGKLRSIIESILFVSGEPLKIQKLAKVTGANLTEVKGAISELTLEYASGRGFILMKKEDQIQLVSNPENAEYISYLIKGEIQENLSQAALETLSIAAYRGPISRADIEVIRGVNSSFTIRALLLRGLLERVENTEGNRGYLYKISFDFMKKLGIDDVSKLPDFENLSRDERLKDILESSK